MLESIIALVKAKDICVLATVAEGKPHCSLMAYVTDKDCSKIYMVTHRRTKKYRNLMENPSVSILIDTREEHPGSRRPQAKALTISGTFEPIDDKDREINARANLLRRHPHLKEFTDDPEAVIFSIKLLSFLLLDGLKEAHFEEVLP